MKKAQGRALVGLVVASALLSGCLPEVEISRGNPLGAFMSVFAGRSGGDPKRTVKSKGTVDITITGSIGGLSGEYDLTLGTYGTFSGTGTIGKNRKSATVKAEDTDELRALVHAVLLDEFATDVTVTTVKAKVVGKQTTGGVKKSWKGSITFQGTVASGPDMGKRVKGKLTSKGVL
jgi:hypothetical protein